MTLEWKAGVRAVVGPNLLSSVDEPYLGATCTIKYFMGSDRNGSYYNVTMEDSGEVRTFYASELDVTPVLTKEEKAAKLRAELEKLEAEIEAEAKEKARNDIKNLSAGSLIELGVDDDSDYLVKVGRNKWKWFSKSGDPLEHHDTTGDDKVIERINLAKLYGYHRIFPSTEEV